MILIPGKSHVRGKGAVVEVSICGKSGRSKVGFCAEGSVAEVCTGAKSCISEFGSGTEIGREEEYITTKFGKGEDSIGAEFGSTEIGWCLEFSVAEVGNRAVLGFGEIGIYTEFSEPKVSICAEDSAIEVDIRSSEARIRSEDSFEKVGNPAEGGAAKVSRRAELKSGEADSFRKPYAAKVEILRFKLLLQSFIEIRDLVLIGVMQYAITAALVLAEESLASAGRAHPFFASTNEFGFGPCVSHKLRQPTLLDTHTGSF